MGGSVEYLNLYNVYHRWFGLSAVSHYLQHFSDASSTTPRSRNPLLLSGRRTTRRRVERNLNLFAISRTDLFAKHHRALHIVADHKVFKNPPKQEAILGVEDFNFSPPPIAGCPKRCQNFIEYQLIVSKVPSPTRAICAPTPTLDTDGMQQKTRFRAAGPFDWAFGNT
jgi:hypothetical protein